MQQYGTKHHFNVETEPSSKGKDILSDMGYIMQERLGKLCTKWYKAKHFKFAPHTEKQKNRSKALVQHMQIPKQI